MSYNHVQHSDRSALLSTILAFNSSSCWTIGMEVKIVLTQNTYSAQVKCVSALDALSINSLKVIMTQLY